MGQSDDDDKGKLECVEHEVVENGN